MLISVNLEIPTVRILLVCHINDYADFRYGSFLICATPIVVIFYFRCEVTNKLLYICVTLYPHSRSIENINARPLGIKTNVTTDMNT